MQQEISSDMHKAGCPALDNSPSCTSAGFEQRYSPARARKCPRGALCPAAPMDSNKTCPQHGDGLYKPTSGAAWECEGAGICRHCMLREGQGLSNSRTSAGSQFLLDATSAPRTRFELQTDVPPMRREDVPPMGREDVPPMRRQYAFDNNFRFLRAERMRAYAEPLDQYWLPPGRSVTPYRQVLQQPSVYRASVSTEIPSGFMDYQTPTKHKEVGPLNLSLEKNVIETPKETMPSSSVSSPKKPSKGKTLQRRITPPKWKKAYNKAVKGNKGNNKVGLVLLGPDGPVLYAKVVHARRLPSTTMPVPPFLSNQERDSGIGQDVAAYGGAGDGPTAQGNQVDDGPNIATPSTGVSRNSSDEGAEKRSLEGESSKALQEDVDRMTEDEKESKAQRGNWSCRRQHESSGSWRTLVPAGSDQSSTKQIFRAKKMSTRSSSCSSKTLTTGHQMDRVASWVKKDVDIYKNSSSGKSSKKGRSPYSEEERTKMLKEALPLIAAESREEHLKQVQNCIVTYVDYLEAKSDEPAAPSAHGDGPPATDSATVSTVLLDPRPLIDAVNHPLRRLASDLTVSVTRSVTDALVTTDKIGKDPVHQSMKKLRDMHFDKVQKEIQKLFQFIRLVDSITGLPRTS